LHSDETLAAITRYTKKGGQIIVYDQIGIADQLGQPRMNNPNLLDNSWIRINTKQDILYSIQKNTTPLFKVDNYPYVLFTITECGQSAKDECNIHLLNYQKQP
jgi:hypothetical protein